MQPINGLKAEGVDKGLLTLCQNVAICDGIMSNRRSIFDEKNKIESHQRFREP